MVRTPNRAFGTKNRFGRLDKVIEITARLMKARVEYTNLLQEELSEVVPIAHAHGWKSSRHKQGEKLRKRIESLHKKLEEA